MSLLCIFCVISIFLYAYKKNSLTLDGFAAGIFVASVILYLGYIKELVILILFFVISSLLTKYKSDCKKGIEEQMYEKNGCRDYQQVFAVSLVGVCCLILCSLYQNEIFLIMFYASVSFSTADTWASEMGVLSKSQPISVITFKKISKGESGGISFLGSLYSFLGSLFISLYFYLFVKRELFFAMLIVLAGIISCFLDSFLGALLQPLYIDDGVITEQKRGKLIKGFLFFTNTMINFLCSCFAGLFTYLVYFFNYIK